MMERKYAELPRRMAEVLSELSLGTVHWLDDLTEHQINPEGENIYARGIYLASSLEAHRENLEALGSLQKEIVALGNYKRVPIGAVIPPVFENCSRLRLLKRTHMIRFDADKTDMLNYLKSSLKQMKETYKKFELYQSQDDPRRETYRDELLKLEAGIAIIQKQKEERFVRRHRVELYMVRVQLEDESKEAYVPKVGLIASPLPKLDIDTAPRRKRSDKVKLEPLLQFQNQSIHGLEAWEAAKAEAKTK